MRILGIDPGTITMGYGVVEAGEEEATLVECGVLSSPRGAQMVERLCYLYQKLQELISRYQPQEIAIEEPFVAKNARSALAVGRAQAMAILAAGLQKVPVYTYTPTQIKYTVADYGASDKKQVQEMVKLHLGLTSAPQPSDAADAVAVALCHLCHTRLNRILSSQEARS